jgi:mRNA-degrading endonuclease RelE of RelBE toxin-antitoxin system
MPNRPFQIVFTPWARERINQYVEARDRLPRKCRILSRALNTLLPRIRIDPFQFQIEEEISDEATFQFGMDGCIKVIFYVDLEDFRVVIVEICWL